LADPVVAHAPAKPAAVLITLAIAGGGGAFAQAIGLPAGLLVGAAVAVSIAAVVGFTAQLPRIMSGSAFVIVGMTLGTHVAQNSLELMAKWPLTLVGLAVSMAFMVVVSMQLLRHVFRFDGTTAYLASFPGHLSFIMAFVESGYGNARQIAIIQSIRVLFLTLLVPLVAWFVTPDFAPLAQQIETMELVPLALLALGCTGTGLIFRRIGVPAGLLLGSMLVATTGKLMGLYEGQLPFPVSAYGFIVMGALIGSRFSGITPAELRRAAVGGTVVSVVSVATVTVTAMVLVNFVDMPFGQIWLGISPGALESMGALGIVLGYDTAFIAVHHAARFFILSFVIPSVAAFGQKSA